MKKLILAFAALVVLSLAGIVGLSFGLRPLVEAQVLHLLNNLSLTPDGKPCQTTVEHIDFAPLSRTVTLRGVKMHGQTPQGPVSFSVAETFFNMPPRMLLAFTPLRDMALGTADMTPVAENITMRNLALQSPVARTSIQREEIDVLRAEGRFILDALTRQKPVDQIKAAYHMGADNARGFFVTVDTPLKDGLTQVNIKETGLKGWRGQAIEELRVEGFQIRVDGHDGLRMASLVQSGITLPDEDLMRRLLLATDLSQTDMTAAMTLMTSLMDEVMAAQPPVVKQIRATGLAFRIEEHTVDIREVGFDWPSNAPRHTSGSILGLNVPAKLLSGLSGFSAPPFKADLTFESVPQGPDARREKSLLKAEGLGDVACALTTHGAAAPAKQGTPSQRAAPAGESLLSQKFSDLSLTFADHGLMAWIGRATAPDPKLAAAALRAATALPNLPPTAQNAAVRTAFQTFMTKPGTLEVRTLPGKNLQALQLLDALADPGALLSVNATPGKQTLEEQIRALNAASPGKTSAPSSGARQ